MFFAFHDDIVAPTYVESLVRALAGNERAVLAFSDMIVHELDGRTRLHVFDQLEGITDPVERGRVMIRRKGDWWVPNRGLFRASAFAAGGRYPPERPGRVLRGLDVAAEPVARRPVRARSRGVVRQVLPERQSVQAMAA